MVRQTGALYMSSATLEVQGVKISPPRDRMRVIAPDLNPCIAERTHKD